MSHEIISLPNAERTGGPTLREAIRGRRSMRQYAPGEHLLLKEISEVLFAAQGLLGRRVRKTVPSAGATYPLVIGLVATEVEGLPTPGVYRYLFENHKLEQVRTGDMRKELAAAALGQGFLAEAPAVLAICALYKRTTERYGDRGEQYVHMEAGHAAQNVSLMAESLGLGTVVVGAFNDREVADLLMLEPEAVPLALMPLGRKP